MEYSIIPIGYLKRDADKTYIEILEKFRPGLKQLDKFSHVQVIWWADRHDNDKSKSILQMTPPYGENPPITGVFASRAEYRPNPVALTTVKILEMNEEKGQLFIQNIDAYDGTPVIDLKAYFPVCDRVKDAYIPKWISGWPDWLPEEGLGL